MSERGADQRDEAPIAGRKAGGFDAAERNVATAREGMAAFRRGDIEAFLALLDPEVEVFSPPEFPNSGRFSGREGYLRWTSQWLDAWETFDVEAQDFEPVGDHHVLIPVVQRGKGKGSGVEVEMRACYMLEYRDGLVRRMHLYPDRETAVQAARDGGSG
jgi:ketosteroid isomerase-like protein